MTKGILDREMTVFEQLDICDTVIRICHSGSD
jgi:hypothetical protein